jgi:hypothetical protein
MNLSRAWCYATTGGVPSRSLVVAVVIGTVLNLINQGDALLGSASVNWLKIALTYVVPYCVSTYGAVSYRMTTADSIGHDLPRDIEK